MRNLAVILTLALASPGLAKKPAPAKDPPPKHLTFGDGDEIEAGPVRPEGDGIDSITHSPKPSLIKIRDNFYKEMLISADRI
jgi:hypothetical protein